MGSARMNNGVPSNQTLERTDGEVKCFGRRGWPPAAQHQVVRLQRSLKRCVDSFLKGDRLIGQWRRAVEGQIRMLRAKAPPVPPRGAGR